MSLIGLVLLPLLIISVAFFVLKGTITWKEFLLTGAMGVAISVVGFQVAKWGALQSNEHLNGRITGKPSGIQKCCHCRQVCTSRDKKGNCTSSYEECDHIHDYWWSLDTTVGEDLDGDGRLTVLDYNIVTSAQTQKVFDSGEAEALDIFGK